MFRHNRRRLLRSSHTLPFVLVLLVATLAVVPGLAKDKPLVAILLFEAPDGPAYVQITDLMLNGKTEVLQCTSGAPIDSNSYKKFPKLKLVQATSIERGSDGVLNMKTASGSFCIVPIGLKIEKNARATAAQLADQITIQGRIAGRSSSGGEAIPPLKPGTKLQFVEAPNTELAEYLRASRWQTVALWRGYLVGFAAGPHAAEARDSLAGLITKAGEAALAGYVESAKTAAPKFELLRAARTSSQDALKVVPNFVRAQKLGFDARSKVGEIAVAGRSEMDAFQKAVEGRTAGFVHLQNAQRHAENALVADSDFEPAQKLQADVNAEMARLNAAVAAAESRVAGKRFDEAYSMIVRYRPFAGELPKVAAVVDAAFAYHRDAAQEAAQKNDLEGAVHEWQRALACKDDAGAGEALKSAQAAWKLQQDKDAAGRAVTQSQAYVEQKQYVEAYELLASLPESQRAFTGDQLAALQAPFIDDAVKRADTLSRVHLPIRGRADEDGIRSGHRYLQEAAKLSDDEMVKVKRDLLSDRMSEYYLKEAQRLLAKPRGSGAGLGWLFLEQAQQYKPDSEAVRDSFTKNAPVYDTRAKLSLEPHFRDQTSRRDSMGFADQLADAVSSGLERLGLPGLRLLSSRNRPAAAADANDIPANFQLQCDIVQHRVAKKEDRQRVASRYRAGQREIRNPAWTQTKRQLDDAQEQYNVINAQVLATASAKKKPAPQLTQTLQELSQSISELRKKLEQIQEFQVEDVILPYSYARRTVELSGIAEFTFRITDATGQTGEQRSVKVEVPKKFAVLENVKPEDVDGVQDEGTPVDEYQLLADTETKAQAELITRIADELKRLPEHVLSDARKTVETKDLEAAAELYVLYLNSTPDADDPGRNEAQQFLSKEFNVTWKRVEAQ